VGGEYRNYVYVSTKGLLEAYAPAVESEHLIRVRYAQLMDADLCKGILTESRRVCEEQDELTTTITDLDVSPLSNRELADLYEQYIQLQQRNHVMFTVSQPEMLVGIEHELEAFARRATSSEEDFVACLFALSAPTRPTDLTRQELTWNEIVLSAAQKSSIVTASKKSVDEFSTWLEQHEPALLASIEQHLTAFGWLPTQEFNDAWTRLDKVAALHQHLQTPANKIMQHVENVRSRLGKLERQREGLIARKLPPPQVLYQSVVIRELAARRWDLRLVRTRADYIARKLRSEIGKRMNITAYDVEHLLLAETFACLRNGVSFDRQALAKRRASYAWVLKDGRHELYTEEQADAVRSWLATTSEPNTTILSGTTASLGFARGTVRKIATGSDSLHDAVREMRPGDILVTGQIRPQLILACRKAGAIVTDEGGIASHAAVVARELGIPCIVGTKDATAVLTDGDTVTVDARAYRGVVRIERRPSGSTETVKWLQDIGEHDRAVVGGKAATLGVLARTGFTVPRGFVLTTDGCLMERNVLEAKVGPYLAALSAPLVAVRSSATSEDSTRDSFAGMFESIINVPLADVSAMVGRVVASVRDERVASYCEERGIDPQSVRMAVVVQEMIAADVSGVCMTVHPITAEPGFVHVSACYGLGMPLMAGEITPDTYLVNTNTWKIIERVISIQRRALRHRGGEDVWDRVEGALQSTPKVSDATAVRLAKRSREIADLLERPVEVEWCEAGGSIYVLQARPITGVEQIEKRGW
jgi:phosphohistidine swiveling domain-containing protein